ncbi:uncharacterized protein LOC113855653 [Abrus precatorius]|uniref:Uncharacterized protein LOC113855653 n=1 Tax=Abrus precatorius TaxID=3816 RepID=A0A8B8KJP2_ABRPR|nr:uncharacterized protein LOC113855653 [Abrus precatorius]
MVEICDHSATVSVTGVPRLNISGRGRGRGARDTNDLMKRMAQILEAIVHNQGGESAEYRGLSAFTRHDPPKFEGGFNPEGAQRWAANVEKIFNAMGCCEENKILPQEDDYIQWETFKTIFLGNYFPRDLRKQKAREFLELKQGSITVGEYVAKFQELMKYWPHYQHGDGEEDLCAQFEHGLRPDIRAAVSVFQLTDLPTLLSKNRIFEANSKGKTVDTRGADPVRQDKRPPRFSKGPYLGSNSSQSSRSSSQEKSSGSGSGLSSFKGPLICFRCGGPHMVKDCPQPRITCNNYGKSGHIANKCWAAKRSGSSSATQRPKSKGSTESSTGQKLSIFTVKRADLSLKLHVTELPYNVVVTTPTGMDWLVANHVLLDCREKTLIFGATMAKVLRLMSQGAWENTVSTKAFMVMFSIETKSVVELEYIPVVSDFLEVFSEEVSELPPEREIEFTIDLILGASSIFVALYRMSPVELAEVKKQVEDLL